MAAVSISREHSKRVVSKSDLLTLLPPGKKKSPVDVRVVVERGTIAFKTLGLRQKQVPSIWKVCVLIILSCSSSYVFDSSTHTVCHLCI